MLKVIDIKKMTACMTVICLVTAKEARTIDGVHPLHGSTWKENANKLKNVVDGIFLAIKGIWSNPICLNYESRKKMNEGSYQTDVIMPIP
ncbi:hypothetical protein GLOIN_2v1632380 [Rhizophagus clarus]|uniref:Uncharacterized protein n=1 Tax=Rhizophagus clarus TaxID=94130 RepID=A0A8H3QUJ2_9GLOM|nr:hypothetical protein GLOIN_2v1632380 [Rhizophagus clarus]